MAVAPTAGQGEERQPYWSVSDCAERHILACCDTLLARYGGCEPLQRLHALRWQHDLTHHGLPKHGHTQLHGCQALYQTAREGAVPAAAADKEQSALGQLLTAHQLPKRPSCTAERAGAGLVEGWAVFLVDQPQRL